MKMMKRIIYTLLGLLLTGVVVLVGIILFAEYSGKRFHPDSDEKVSELSFTDEDSRLVYDENGNIAELPAGALSGDTADNTDAAPNTEDVSAVPSTGTPPEEPAGNASGELFIMDTGNAVYHKESCPENISIAEENKRTMTGSSEDVQNRGYTPCPTCNP